jgi:hypothetical protein
MRDGFVAGGQNPYLIVIVQPKILILIVITQLSEYYGHQFYLWNKLRVHRKPVASAQQ